MQKQGHKGGLRQVGTEVINRQTVPVYELPDGTRYIEIIDASGKPTFLSRDGAKTFKAQQYPFHPDVEQVVVQEIVSADRPFALEDQEEQARRADRLLRSLMSRVFDAGVDLQFSMN